ncbi:MAG: tetratricopeptide repeat protein [Chloroflexota bacterium]
MTIDPLFFKASQAHQHGDLPQAEQLYRQLLAQVPAHAETLHRLGLICSQLARHSEAIEYLQQAIAVDAGNAIYQHNLGEAWRRQDRFDEAVQAYRQALALAPDFAEAHFSLANVLRHQGEVESADHHYRQAIRFKPAYTKASRNLSNLLAEQGQMPEAQAFAGLAEQLSGSPPFPSTTRRLLFLDPLHTDYTVNTPYQQALGGSQSAVCYLSEALARQGHTLYLLNRTSRPCLARGVLSLTLPAKPEALGPLLHQLRLDAIIVLNYSAIVSWIKPHVDPQTRLILWTQHAHDQGDIQTLQEPETRNAWDEIVFVSDWQKQQYITRFDLDPEHCTTLRNAISPAFGTVPPAPILAQKLNPPTLIYTSTPFRGLDRLLDAFPHIRAVIPQVQLKIFSSLKVYQRADIDAQFQHLYQRAASMEGVDYIGSIPQPELAKELSQATMLAYPNTYAETSCIAVMEAMASGCVVVTSDLGALPETCAGFGQLIPFELTSDQYLTRFVQTVVAVLKQMLGPERDLVEQHLQRQVGYVNQQYRWAARAQAWLNWLETVERAPTSSPDNVVDLHYRANILRDEQKLEAAVKLYQKALTLHPQQPDLHYDLGQAWQKWDKLGDATISFRQAIQLKPDFFEAHHSLGYALEKQGDLDGARQAYEQALFINPNTPVLKLHLAALFPQIAPSGTAISRYQAQLIKTLDAYQNQGVQLDINQLHMPPGNLIYQGTPNRDIKERWASLYRNSFPTLNRTIGSGKPHVGFVVTRGSEGVFIKCMGGIIDRLPRDRFEVSIVCDSPIGEQFLREDLHNPATHYIPFPTIDTQTIDYFRTTNFDILHFWEVGTDLTNYFLPFFRLAPIQCATWGWPETTGLSQIDYFISSEGLDPAGNEAHYTEELVRLKQLPTYYYRPPIPETPLPRHRLDLTDQQTIYFCQQNLRKVHPDFDPLAAEILRRDRQGVLLFVGVEGEAAHITESLHQRFRQTMPNALDRIRFLPRLPAQDYLGLVALADVILDTPYYTGGANTTYDAFAAGTPIVTLPTQYHRGRYTTAAYQQIGLADCIATSPDKYIELALRLGTDDTYRATISQQLRQASHMLFEDVTAVTELADFFEEALAKMGKP